MPERLGGIDTGRAERLRAGHSDRHKGHGCSGTRDEPHADLGLIRETLKPPVCTEIRQRKAKNDSDPDKPGDVFCEEPRYARGAGPEHLPDPNLWRAPRDRIGREPEEAQSRDTKGKDSKQAKDTHEALRTGILCFNPVVEKLVVQRLVGDKFVPDRSHVVQSFLGALCVQAHEDRSLRRGASYGMMMIG